METKVTVGRGTAALFVGNITGLVANTVYFIILANVLHSTIEVGVVTSLNIMIWFFVFVCVLAQPVVLGSPIPAPLAVLKFIPGFLAKDDRSAASTVFKVSLALSIAIGLMAAAILTTMPSLVIPLLGGQAIVPDYVRLSAVDILVISAGQICLGGVIALGGSNVAGSYLIAWNVARYAFASVLLVNYGVTGVLIGWVIGDLALLFVALHWTLKILGRQVGLGSFSGTELARYSIYTMFAALIGFAINQADRLIILWQRGLSGMAVYNAAMVGAGVAGYVPYALVTVLLPALTALSVSGKTMQIHDLIRSYTRYVSLVVIPIGFGLAAAMETLLRIFGVDYVSGMLAAATVSVATGLTAIGIVYAGALLALGKMRWYTAANLLGLVVLLTVAGTLTPILGLNGPALGRASLMAVAAIVYALAAYRSGIFEIDSRAYFIAVISSAAMMLVIFGALSTIHGFVMKIVALPALALVGLLVYVGGLRSFHLLTIGDLDFFYDLMPKRLHFIMPGLARLAGLHLSSKDD
jgi:O-antigen/teichoic acid export membrane protein